MKFMNNATDSTEEINVYCCKEEQQQKPVIVAPIRRAVHFAKYYESHAVDHLDDIDNDMITDIWYTRTDYQQIRSSNAAIVRKMLSTNDEFDDEENSTRGLEHKTKAGQYRRRTNKASAIQAVLREQERQLVAGTVATLSLASIYISEACSSKESALAYGLLDALEVHGHSLTESNRRKMPNNEFPRRIGTKSKIHCFLIAKTIRRKKIRDDIKNSSPGTSSYRK